MSRNSLLKASAKSEGEVVLGSSPVAVTKGFFLHPGTGIRFSCFRSQINHCFGDVLAGCKLICCVKLSLVIEFHIHNGRSSVSRIRR